MLQLRNYHVAHHWLAIGTAAALNSEGLFVVDSHCTCYPYFKGHCDYGNDIGFLATKCHTLVFRLFQSPVSGTQHKAEDSVLLAVCDAYCEQSRDMLTLVGDRVVC